MRKIVKKLVEKHWDSNWHDSRTVEGEVDWIMKFAPSLVIATLEERLKEIGEQEVTVPLTLEAEYLGEHIKALKQQQANLGGDE